MASTPGRAKLTPAFRAIEIRSKTDSKKKPKGRGLRPGLIGKSDHQQNPAGADCFACRTHLLLLLTAAAVAVPAVATIVTARVASVGGSRAVIGLAAGCRLVARSGLVARSRLRAGSWLVAGGGLAAGRDRRATARRTAVVAATVPAMTGTGAAAEERKRSHCRHTDSNETLHQETSVRVELDGVDSHKQTVRPASRAHFRDASPLRANLRKILRKLPNVNNWKLCDNPKIRKSHELMRLSSPFRIFGCDIGMTLAKLCHAAVVRIQWLANSDSAKHGRELTNNQSVSTRSGPLTYSYRNVNST